MIEAQRKKDAKLEEDVEKMRKERGDILEDAKALALGLKKLEDDFKYTGLEFEKSPEEMLKLLEKFEMNADRAAKALDEVNMDFGRIRSSQAELEDMMTLQEDPIEGLPTSLEQEIKERKNHSTAKLTDLLSRVKKQHSDFVNTFVDDIDKDIRASSSADVEAALVPILQRKCYQLKKETELAESKARSITAQW